MESVRAGRRLTREWDVPDVEPPPPTRLGKVSWIEPYPDTLLDGALSEAPGPEARYEQSESISLAFVTALQILPPRQLSVLVLRDVLGYRSDEVADMLGSSAEAVKSALKRARANLEQGRPPATPTPAGRAENRIVADFVRAWESADVAALVALLTDDVILSMPPMPFEYEGLDVAARFCSSIFRAGRRFDLLATRASGQPAFGAYLRGAHGSSQGVGLYVLTLAGDRIRGLTRSDNSVLPAFCLPNSLRTTDQSRHSSGTSAAVSWRERCSGW